MVTRVGSETSNDNEDHMSEALTVIAGAICLVGFGWGVVGMVWFIVDDMLHG